MNRREAGLYLSDKGERRFYIQGNNPVFIVDRKVSSHPNHKEIADDLVKSGVLGSLLGLSGGYCISLEGRLRYWGTTAGSIPDATEKQFNQTIDSSGATIVS